MKHAEALDASPSPEPTSTQQPVVSSTESTDNTLIDNSSDDNVSQTQDGSLLGVQIEQARNDGLMYIQANHPETALLSSDAEWQGGISSAGSAGTQRYDFYAGGWNVTVQFSGSVNPIFTVTVRYSGDWQVNWQGTDQTGNIQEISYTSNIPKLTPTPAST